MKRFSRLRKTITLSDSVYRHVSMYTIAAEVAGLGLLACAQPSWSEVVYTAAHQVIGSERTYNLDLNHDGVTDFVLQNYTNTFEGSPQGFLFVVPARGEDAVEAEKTYNRAYALPPGIRVGPGAPFFSMRYQMMVSADAAERCFGNWNNVRDRYLGLRFVINQEAHYGWARLSVGCNRGNNKIFALLTGYAYETDANRPIVTGQTADREEPAPASLRTNGQPRPSLGILALGSQGLAMWRREE